MNSEQAEKIKAAAKFPQEALQAQLEMVESYNEYNDEETPAEDIEVIFIRGPARSFEDIGGGKGNVKLSEFPRFPEDMNAGVILLPKKLTMQEWVAQHGMKRSPE